MKDTLNFLLAGVGGQGTILASDVLVNVGLAAGLAAKQAEVHGMSQRGGDVTSHVRWGKVIYSPMAGAGEVDVLLAFEKTEALRNLRYLRSNALVLINDEAILPVTVTSGGQPYPDDERVRAAVGQVTERSLIIQGAHIAADLGNAKAANVVLLGALSALLETADLAPAGLTVDTWLAVIGERVPAKYLELNKRAFQAGRALALEAAPV
jgi:indolepyruvate ferredoxin oxidoreductase, beta subunit